ncbi:MAG: MBL fold metallo-hydrolase [Flavobacteriales bacterium]|nr:MBL fold metallo-hydrolase [Flavobacteriales bacterium]
MMQIEIFTVNPFYENTYILHDETGEGIIIDPGMYTATEQTTIKEFVAKHAIQLQAIVNTHGHIDHVMGVEWCRQEYGIPFHMNEKDLVNIEALEMKAQMFGVSMQEVNAPEHFIQEGENVRFGNTELEVLFTPGHAPGHVVFVNHQQQVVIGGDVLFKGSVGRVDLPYCDPAALEKSIREKLYQLPDTYQVYPGHGPSTTIGIEKRSNPFVNEKQSSLL